MLIVDASCLVELVTDGPRAASVRLALEADEFAAPHIVDVETFGVIRRDYLSGALHPAAAALAVTAVEQWPGERFGHRLLLGRAWELRDSVRGWDAMYVALAEALGATLLTLDGRLATAHGPTCRIEVPGHQDR